MLEKKNREVRLSKQREVVRALDPVGNLMGSLDSLLDGGDVGERQFTVTRLPADAPQPTVTIDRHNRTLVNGKPFFPLGWYFGPHPGDANYREHLDRIAASPFNTVMPYGINTGSVEACAPTSTTLTAAT